MQQGWASLLHFIIARVKLWDHKDEQPTDWEAPHFSLGAFKWIPSLWWWGWEGSALLPAPISPHAPVLALRGPWGASAPRRELLGSSVTGRALGIPSLLLSEPGSLWELSSMPLPGFHGLCLLLPFPSGEGELRFGGVGSCRTWLPGIVQTPPLWQKGTRLLSSAGLPLAFLRGLHQSWAIHVF